MPFSTKVVQPGVVASVINSLHKLEYESGRMERPAQVTTKNTLMSNRPAEKHRRDTDVSHHGESIPVHHNKKSRNGYCASHMYVVPKLEQDQDSANGVDHCLHMAGRSPFRRRDSISSVISSPPYGTRESVSHRAFERVRSASTSPRPAMPIPWVEIDHPYGETAQQYIARKLAKRWSPSPSSATGRHEPGRGSATKPSSKHVDAPFVQEVLHNIDVILTEHTTTLRNIIDDSSRILHERMILCDEDNNCVAPHQQSSPQSIENGADASISNSSVPDLIAIVDQTAVHLGLSLPDHHIQHPDPTISYQVQRDDGHSVSPNYGSAIEQQRSLATNKHVYNHHGDETLSLYDQSIPLRRASSSTRSASPMQLHESTKDHERCLATADGLLVRSAVSQQWPHHSVSKLDRSLLESPCQHQDLPKQYSQQLEDRGHGVDQIDALWSEDEIPQPHRKVHHHPHDHLSSALLVANHQVDAATSTHKCQSFQHGKIDYRASLSPSPALIEYDRFAALADRASRNSVSDLVDTAAIARSAPEIDNHRTNDSDIQLSQRLVSAPQSQGHLRDEDVDTAAPSSKCRVSDVWIEGSGEKPGQAKVKRESTWDKPKKQRGSEAKGNERVVERWLKTVDDRRTKPIKEAGRRQTARMMDSIMTRQGRDKDRGGGRRPQT